MKINVYPTIVLEYFLAGDYDRVAQECKVSKDVARRYVKRLLASMGYTWKTAKQKDAVKAQLHKKLFSVEELA